MSLYRAYASCVLQEGREREGRTITASEVRTQVEKLEQDLEQGADSGKGTAHRGLAARRRRPGRAPAPLRRTARRCDQHTIISSLTQQPGSSSAPLHATVSGGGPGPGGASAPAPRRGDREQHHHPAPPARRGRHGPRRAARSASDTRERRPKPRPSAAVEEDRSGAGGGAGAAAVGIEPNAAPTRAPGPLPPHH